MNSECEIYICDNSGCREGKEVFENVSLVKEHIWEKHRKGLPTHYTFSYYICNSKYKSEKEVIRKPVRIEPNDLWASPKL